MMSASNIPKYLYVSFSSSVQIFSWFGSSIISVICRFPLFLICLVHFSMLNSIPMSWLYILTANIRVSNSFLFWPTVWYCPCTLGNWSFPTISICLCLSWVIIYYVLRVLYTRISWWSFTGVWVTASLLKSLGLFSVFLPISTMLKFYNFSSLFTNLLGIVPSTLITNGITVTSMFHSIFTSLGSSKYSALFSFSLIFTLWSSGSAKSTETEISVVAIEKGAFGSPSTNVTNFTYI